MATPDHRPRRNSRTNGTKGTKVPGFHPGDWPQMPESAARASLTGLDLMESWLTASRQMIDLWRTTVREQQDSMLAACRHQIANAASDEVMEDMAPRPRSARRRSPMRPSAARRTDDSQAVTRH